MDNAVVTLQCQNITCLASNPESNQVCEKCGTPLVRRYLRVLGDWVKNYYPPGTILEERYLFKQSQIVLDTKPALSPQAPEDFPDYIVSYLKLFAHRLHIPQIYGYIPTPDERIDMNIWFLEYGSIPTTPEGELQYPDLLPRLDELWSSASALRQLNWLWQIARLWKPLQNQRVVSSLLEPNLLRVNSRIIQILELKLDPNQAPSLKQLGEVWNSLLDDAAPTIKDFLGILCNNLQQGQITRPEQLIGIFDQALARIGHSQQRSYQILTATDTGLMRDHNEDACYPLSGHLVKVDEPQIPLTIVCDGIGGQEGGEIASQLAIDTLLKEINEYNGQGNSDVYKSRIEQAILTTNDVICLRNDQENRQERKRMGTTLLMGIGYDHEMYISHVGDSRVYLITPNSCHQITVDDDLASREVRLGYLIYRDAVQYPNAGALVQALGMGSGSSLHPTIERFIIDEDCIFLLCSDGLSDYDRVEQFWSTEIAPILSGTKTIEEVVPQLINLANERNGHDNVTISLIYCQVKSRDGYKQTPVSYFQLESAVTTLSGATVIEDTEEQPITETPAAQMPTVPSFEPEDNSASDVSSADKSSPSNALIILAGVVGLLLIGGTGFYLARQFLSPNSSQSPTISPTVTATPEREESPLESPISEQIILPGTLIQVTQDIELSPTRETSPVNSETDISPAGIPVRQGEVLQVSQSEGESILLSRCFPKNQENDLFDTPQANQGWISRERLQEVKSLDFVPEKDNFICVTPRERPQFSQPSEGTNNL